MGRNTRGLIGIRLAKGDEVVGMEVVAPHTQILTVVGRGYGKRSKASDYRIQNRGRAFYRQRHNRRDHTRHDLHGIP